jgi:alpha-beta hydrolase superfamily lysophospholipase
MENQLSKLTNKQGLKLVTYDWSIDNAKANLLIIHGYAEHAQRYKTFAEKLNQKAISVYTFDQQGYGQSEGLRGYVKRFDNYIDDIDLVVKKLNLPKLFIMGHSMGGLLAVRYCIDHPSDKIAGIISSSASLEIDPNLSPILQKLAPVISAILPKLATEKLDKTYLTRVPAVLEAYMNDPLIYLGGTRARFGAEILSNIKKVGARFSEIGIPLLAQHGTADRLTMPNGTKKLYDEAGSLDKTLKLYDGLYHELIHEPEKEEVIANLSEWILDRAT